MSTEQQWRKAIADQIRRNCTPSSEAYAAGGDTLISAVADWIENPPEWSKFESPDAAPKVRIVERAFDPARRASPTSAHLRVGATVRSRWSSSGALWTVESFTENRSQSGYGPRLTLRSVKTGLAGSRYASDFNIVEEVSA